MLTVLACHAVDGVFCSSYGYNVLWWLSERVKQRSVVQPGNMGMWVWLGLNPARQITIASRDVHVICRTLAAPYN